MTFFSRTAFTALAATVIVLSGPSARAEDDAIFSAEQKEAIEKVVHDYLLENGEVITNSIERLQKKYLRVQEEKNAERLEELESVFETADLPIAGNPDGDVTIVEFFDYNCGYCKRAFSDVKKLIENDKNVRVVFIEMPILSALSEDAAKWALAVYTAAPEKYFDFHSALMSSRAPKSEGDLKKIVKDLGLDPKETEKAANSDEVANRLQDMIGYGSELGISGTPAFIINGQIVRGHMGYTGMKAAIDNARKETQK